MTRAIEEEQSLWLATGEMGFPLGLLYESLPAGRQGTDRSKPFREGKRDLTGSSGQSYDGALYFHNAFVLISGGIRNEISYRDLSRALRSLLRI